MNLTNELIYLLVSIKPKTGLVRHKVDTSPNTYIKCDFQELQWNRKIYFP